MGLDTMSVDYGLSRDFVVHHLLGKAGRYGLENLAHLDKLPPRGFYLFVAPMKIETGSGGPTRVFAVLAKLRAPPENVTRRSQRVAARSGHASWAAASRSSARSVIVGHQAVASPPFGRICSARERSAVRALSAVRNWRRPEVFHPNRPSSRA